MQNTHFFRNYSDLHDSLLTIVAVFNRPQRDELMIKASTINLERALFPLLVQISRYGPVGIVELADRVGRDYTTISRQVMKLEQAGLAKRQKNVKDKRINEAIITALGKSMTNKIDVAREEIYNQIFIQWQDAEFAEFERLLNKFVTDFSTLKGIDHKE